MSKATPMSRVLEKLGTTPIGLMRQLVGAGHENLTHSTVYRWSYPQPKGTGGLIPQKYHGAIIRIAKAQKVKLTADDLIAG